MKNTLVIWIVLSVGVLLQSCNNHTHPTVLAKPVNPDLFIANNDGFAIETIDCTLSNGTKSKCYKITTNGLIPTDHNLGPWCPEDITDDASKGGYWFKDGKLYTVDGQFIKQLDALYHDDFWKLYDDNGKINKTTTKEDCLDLVGAQLVDKFKNYCIECLPEYISAIKKTYIIPSTPVKLETPIPLGGGPPGSREAGPPKRERGQGPPPQGGGGRGPAVRGIAFNGVAFDAPAPLQIILKGYTIPPLDKAGGHINLDAGYHYHAATGLSTKHSHKDNHAAMIGYAMDGYGLYEQLNIDGTEPTDLDSCRGHSDTVRGYHYHVDAAGNNNFINCFSGATATE